MQPTREQKRIAIEAPEQSQWEFRVNVPPVCTVYWKTDDWITYIGDQWFLKPEKPEK